MASSLVTHYRLRGQVNTLCKTVAKDPIIVEVDQPASCRSCMSRVRKKPQLYNLLVAQANERNLQGKRGAG